MAGLLVPFLDAILRIGGDARVVIDYIQTGAVFLSTAWLAIVASIVLGEAIVASERLTIRSLDNQLIRLGTRLIGLVAAIAILIKGGDELGFPAYSIIAGLGVGGLAVALAAQSTIANLIGSLLIAIEKPFRVGHVVRVGGSEGTVEDVGFRSTRIRTPDNSLVTIPSSAVVNTTVENLSVRTKRRQRFFVQVTYDTPREKVEELVARIRQLIVDHPLAEESTCQVRFNNFGESSLDILVIVPSPGRRLRGRAEGARGPASADHGSRQGRWRGVRFPDTDAPDREYRREGGAATDTPTGRWSGSSAEPDKTARPAQREVVASRRPRAQVPRGRACRPHLWMRLACLRGPDHHRTSR